MQKIVKIIVLLILFCSLKPLQAQYNIVVSEPTIALTFNQLWNFNISYTGSSQNNDYYIEIQAVEQNEGPLFNVKTNTFKLSTPGLTVFSSNISQLQPLNIVINKTTPYFDLVYKGGLFPAGNYLFTYNLYKLGQGGAQLVQNYSFSTEIETFGTIIQLNPVNTDTINNYNPVFNWVYSGLQLINPRAIFKFKLVELQEKQNPYDAIYFGNTYYEENIKNSATNLQYPTSARKLQMGKTYAWQVSVINGNKPVVQSEVWTFTLAEKKEKPRIPIWYIEATNKNDGYAIVTDNILKIAYKNQFKDTDAQLTYRIINANGKTVLDNTELPLTVAHGDNRYEIDLCRYYKKIKKGLHTVIITDDLSQNGT